jgi:hypothetical protein
VVVQEKRKKGHLGQDGHGPSPNASKKYHLEGPSFGDDRRHYVVVVGDGIDREIHQKHGDDEGEDEKGERTGAFRLASPAGMSGGNPLSGAEEQTACAMNAFSLGLRSFQAGTPL